MLKHLYFSHLKRPSNRKCWGDNIYGFLVKFYDDQPKNLKSTTTTTKNAPNEPHAHTAFAQKFLFQKSEKGRFGVAFTVMHVNMLRVLHATNLNKFPYKMYRITDSKVKIFIANYLY